MSRVKVAFLIPSLSGVEAERILPAIDLAVRGRGTWAPPPEYLVGSVSQIVAKIVLGIA